MFGFVLNILRGDIGRRVHAFKVTAVLVAAASAALLVAAGFALALLYVWLAGLYGTMIALAIIAGGFAVLALILFLIAFLRPAAKAHAVHRAAPDMDVAAAAESLARSQRTIEESLAAVQQGSRESMLAALALAVVTGLALGRKL